jgi:hypothetical protein
MKHVSLNKIKPSALLKVPGLLILGLLATVFLLFPLAAFAGCGGKQDVPNPTAKATFLEPLFGPSCGGSKATTNATVTGTAPKTPTGNPPVQPVATGSSLLSAIAKCHFVTIKDGQQVLLHNGDLVLAQITDPGNKGKQVVDKGDPILCMVVGGQLLPIAGHGSTTINPKKVNFQLANAKIQLDNGNADSTPNDGDGK